MSDQALVIYEAEKTNGIDYLIIEVNEAACKLFHLPEKELIGRSIYEFLPENELKQLARFRGQVMYDRPQTQKLPLIEYTFKRRDGTFFRAQVETTRHSDENLITSFLWIREGDW